MAIQKPVILDETGQKIVEQLQKISGKMQVDESVISDAYDPAKAYAVGDYCIYEDRLYKCSVATTAGETWTSSHWSMISVSDEVAGVKVNIENLGGTLDKTYVEIGTGYKSLLSYLQTLTTKDTVTKIAVVNSNTLTDAPIQGYISYTLVRVGRYDVTVFAHTLDGRLFTREYQIHRSAFAGDWVEHANQADINAINRTLSQKFYIPEEVIAIDETIIGTKSGVTFSKNSDGTWTISGTSTESVQVAAWEGDLDPGEYLITFEKVKGDVVYSSYTGTPNGIWWFLYKGEGDVANCGRNSTNDFIEFTLSTKKHLIWYWRVPQGNAVDFTFRPHLYRVVTATNSFYNS